MNPRFLRRVTASGVLVVLCASRGAEPVHGQCSLTVVTSRHGNGWAGGVSLSANGLVMAFHSAASDLVADDTNGLLDIFVFDRLACALERVSVDSVGAQAVGSSFNPSVSDDGRYVAFESDAPNLVAGDTNQWRDIFVRDRLSGTTSRVSLGSGGQATGGWSTFPEISADGLVVAFLSEATNLVAGDTNAARDVFVRDLAAGTTERVSVTSDDTQGENPTSSFGNADRPGLSQEGRYVVYTTRLPLAPEDVNLSDDVYRRDRLAGETVLISVGMSAESHMGMTPAISGDGRYVAFASILQLTADDLNPSWDVFVRDITLSTTTVGSRDSDGTQGTGASMSPSLSTSGRFLAFDSTAPDLVLGDTNGVGDVFVRDQMLGVTRRVSTTVEGLEGNLGSRLPALSGVGGVVGFESEASNLVSGDINGVQDAFATPWTVLSVPPGINLIRNGDFNGGTAQWLTFATPDMSYMTWDTSGAVFRFYRSPPPPGAINQAVVFQNTTGQLRPFAPLEAAFDLANSSSVRKRISVLVHDASFADLHVCTFWLEALAPMRTYAMRTHTTGYWQNATISFYAATAGFDGGYYEVDNVTLEYDPEGASDRTECVDPTAPAPPGGAPGPTLLTNGDFSAGLTGWALFGQITTFVSSGVLNFVRPPGTPAGVVLQPTNQPLPASQIVTASFDLGNSSMVRKRVTIIVHEWNFSDLIACTFWLSAGQPLSPYAIRARTTKAWTGATLSIYPATVGPEQWTRVDNVVLQTTPSTPVVGTECLEPAAASLAGGTAPAAVVQRIAGAGPSTAHRNAVQAPALATTPTAMPVGKSPALVVWIPPGETAGVVELSADGQSWRAVAFVPAAASWQLLDLDGAQIGLLGEGAVYLRLTRHEAPHRR